MNDRKPLEAKKISLAMNVNGRKIAVEAYPMARLLDVLREDLELTGTKEGCGEGECGACSVMMNGELVNACLVPFAQAKGAEIRTVEGLAEANAGAGLSVLHPIQCAFIEHGGAQCGICTPGMLIASAALLDREPAPTGERIREALSGNLCRCTGYMKIVDSVAHAAREISVPAEVSP